MSFFFLGEDVKIQTVKEPRRPAPHPTTTSHVVNWELNCRMVYTATREFKDNLRIGNKWRDIIT